MKPYALLLLRISLGLLMVWWGLDKIVDPGHGIAVSDTFYGGFFSFPQLLVGFGVAQTGFGLLYALGLWRAYTGPLMLLITAVTLLSVWRSVIDPWGWVLAGSNALFYPSLVIFAGALVLHSLREDERLAIDRVLMKSTRSLERRAISGETEGSA